MLVIGDDFLRFTWLYFMRTKGKANAILKLFLPDV